MRAVLVLVAVFSVTSAVARPLAPIDPIGDAIRGAPNTSPKVTAMSPDPMPTPVYDEPDEDPAVVELRRIRKEVRRARQEADVARQNAENDRRHDAALRSLDRIQDGLDRDSAALKARRADAGERDDSGLITVFDRRGTPSYYIGRSDGVLFDAN